MGITLFTKLQTLFRVHRLSSLKPPFYTKTNPEALHFIVISPSSSPICDNFSIFVLTSPLLNSSSQVVCGPSLHAGFRMFSRGVD